MSAATRAAAMSSRNLLEHAARLLDEPPAVFATRWPRAVALLTRQALERSLVDLWTKRDAKVGWATERSQLLCLPQVLGNPTLAADAALAWNGLSAACHQHAYDLPPTAGELAGWLDTVDELRRVIDRIPARGGRS
jgi:hypothetical protein